MDNRAVQKVKGVKEVTRAAGARPNYPPPHPTDLKAIEMAWSEMKALIRARSPQPSASSQACSAIRSPRLRLAAAAATSKPSKPSGGRLRELKVRCKCVSVRN